MATHCNRRLRCKNLNHRGQGAHAVHKRCYIDPTGDPAVKYRNKLIFPPEDYNANKVFITQPPVQTVYMVVESVGRDAKHWTRPLCSLHVPTGVRFTGFCLTAMSIVSSHEAATGESLPLSKLGFLFVDPVIFNVARERLEPEQRYDGDRESCEKAAGKVAK